ARRVMRRGVEREPACTGPACLRAQPAILEHAERREHAGALVAAAEARARAARLPPARDVDAVERDRAGIAGELAREHVDERRLAGAVGADQRVHLPARERDRHAVDGGDATEAAHDAGGLEWRRDRLCGHRTLLRAVRFSANSRVRRSGALMRRLPAAYAAAPAMIRAAPSARAASSPPAR